MGPVMQVYFGAVDGTRIVHGNMWRERQLLYFDLLWATKVWTGTVCINTQPIPFCSLSIVFGADR